MIISKISTFQSREIGLRLKAIRKLLILSLKKVATGSDLTVASLKRLEEGKGNVHLINLLKLLTFYGVPVLEFFDFSKKLKDEKTFRANMINFHQEHDSDRHKILDTPIDLIDLIELRLLDLNLFREWVDVQTVDEYIRTAFGITYKNISGSLLTAIKNGWLISRKKHSDNAKARVNEYIIIDLKDTK
ncbi:helix-turn-helix domain-containing protein [Sphingobacterium paucimobilis]|uniref:HTH cro/C1-type domain-containing protein n=1 Tax=Sphingobacterium paucimobilis HER1398 TaxID=1346330 RepID=U2JDX4_9SPHI|nr:helix-turn-helix transcriptional regulator [Sphingobacterium paucimobilis]ERJ60883.1 hypothetical protein M472_19190 [Sphingobacterium paucimobilis HER1398]